MTKPSPEEVLLVALSECVTPSEAASYFVSNKKKRQALAVRVVRHLKEKKHGEKIYELFLKRASGYVADAQHRMASEEIEDLAVENSIPITWLAESNDRYRRAYQFWYLRFMRGHPNSLDRVLEREQEERRPPTYDYFTVRPYECS